MRGMKCMGKETEGRKFKVMGGRYHQEAKSRGQRSWCRMPKGSFAGCQGVALILSGGYEPRTFMAYYEPLASDQGPLVFGPLAFELLALALCVLSFDSGLLASGLASEIWPFELLPLAF